MKTKAKSTTFNLIFRGAKAPKKEDKKAAGKKGKEVEEVKREPTPLE